ncbi:MAG TPA: hypothetical protein GX727_06430 [Clostridium sp.]|nr:hypothetical protein [Clostridium sp.]
MYGKEYTNNDNSIALVDKKGEFTFFISSDVINNQALNNMRQIIGDTTSSNQQIFYKIFEYKISHFKALVEHSENNFYFTNQINSSPETYIKIFKEEHQTLFEENSNIILFNTIEKDKQSVLEETSVNITIPSSLNMTIYSINITGKKGFLTEDNINRISLLLQGLSIPNSKNINNTLNIFLDKELIDRANQGIYPDFDKIDVEFVEYINEKQNYKLSHPSTFIPYLQNSMVSSLDYVSFKINYNTHYSITVETLDSPDTYVIDKKEQLKSLYNDKLIILGGGKANISNEYYDFLKYKIEKDSGILYVTQVYIVYNLKLFTISLNSHFEEASTTILNIFKKIISSLEFTKSNTVDAYNENIAFDKSTNNSNEYSFLYPVSWTITNESKTTNSTIFYVSSPEYSTSLDVLVGEYTPYPTLSKEHLFKFIAKNDTSLKEYFKDYNIPYSKTPHKILNTSFKEENDVLYIYKLINYLDQRDRYRLAYSVDIIHCNKIYSLFISINDFLASGTDYTDNRLMYILDIITQSFDIERNTMYLASVEKDTVFTKNDFRKVLCANALLTRPAILNHKNDILIYPAIFIFAQNPEIFPYVIKVNFGSRQN